MVVSSGQMSEAKIQVGRRAFLRGLGVSVALPGLSSLGMAKAAVAARGVTATGAPLRMAFLYIPNGVIMDKWRPRGTGADFAFNESMVSLEKYKGDLQVIKGLEQANGWAGPSSHDPCPPGQGWYPQTDGQLPRAQPRKETRPCRP